MVPSARLIWLVALVGFPASIVLGLFPAARIPAESAIALVLVAAIGDALQRNRALEGLRVELPPLLRSVESRDVTFPVLIHNRDAKARVLRLGFAPPEGVRSSSEDQMVRLPEGSAAVKLSWTCFPERRGRHMLDACYIEGASPLGLWTVRRREDVSLDLRVYPNLRDDAAFLAPRRTLAGAHNLRQIGRGREFERLREYQPGDPADEIHWKATARRGRPITKVFQVERTQEVYVIIDTSRLSGRENALDRSIKAALLAGAAVERHGDLFGVAAFSQQVEAFVRARAGKTHYAACRDAIYQLRTRAVSPDFDEIATFLRLRLRRRSLLLFLTALDDPLIAEQFTRATRLLAARHLVVAGTIRPPGVGQVFSGENVETTRDVYSRLAGHLSWRKLRELESTLSRQGVRLLLIEPEKFALSLIGVYDEIKQRQLV